MSRILHRSIEILEFASDGFTPRVFRDRGVIRVITDLIDRWAESGDWLNGERDRWVFRILTEDMGVFDIERVEEPVRGAETRITAVDPERYVVRWYLYRVWD
ncbi:hypothetical protein [Alicyclobacillus macrosporangiidus]|uniref:hypothetical protein n=1 Tax=Alicyclobacillus macrosporangiidus TaxID=392015 RepID=UPI000496DDD1|nr:hypothetical protein [Alicyclobacillus macrosporangiidus]